MVAPENLGRIIDEHPFFAGIGETLHALLIGCAANERFEAGQTLFHEGEPSKKFYLIRSGSVMVEIDVPGRPPIIVETIDDGEVLGWSWMVAPHRSTFTARAGSLVRAVSFDATCLTRKMNSDPALGYEVMKRFIPVMAHRIQAARMQMLDLYGPGGQAEGERAAVEVVRAVEKSKGSNRRADAKLGKAEAKKDKDKGKAKKKAKAAKR